MLSRRQILRAMSTAGVAGLAEWRPPTASAELPPETRQFRIVEIPSSCRSPEWMAEELLHAEGFTDVKYIRKQGTQGLEEALASGEAHISGHFAAPVILRLEAGDPIVVLGGEHAGCFELFGHEHIRSVRDLKGKAVAIPAFNSSQHAFIASMVAHVGLDAGKDIVWVRSPAEHPIATKLAVRAILKATAICALEPERTARAVVAKGLAKSYDHTLQAIKGLPYGRWREFDSEDTVRFYALRLHEAGMIKSTPHKIIAQGTDWRFFNELKKELKG